MVSFFLSTVRGGLCKNLMALHILTPSHPYPNMMFSHIKEYLKNTARPLPEVVLAIDKSVSTQDSHSYAKIADHAVSAQAGVPGGALFVFWGRGRFYVTDDIPTARRAVVTVSCGGTSAVDLVEELRSLPNLPEVELMVLTDGQVSDHPYCPVLSYNRVTVHCVNLSPYGVTTDMSLTRVFRCSALTVLYTDLRSGDKEPEKKVGGYDARNNTDLFDGVNTEILKLLSRDRVTPSDVRDVLDPYLGNLGMALYENAHEYERLRASVKRVVADLLHRKKKESGASAPISGLSVLRSVVETTELDTAIAYLQDALSLLGRQVTSLSIDLKQPALCKRGSDVPEVPVDANTFVDGDADGEGDLKSPCFITYEDSHTVLPTSRTDMSQLTDDVLLFPLSPRAIRFVMKALQPPMSSEAYNNWIGKMKGVHPTTRVEINGGIPILDFNSRNPADRRKAEQVVKSQLASSLFDGKMMGPWARWLSAVAVAASQLEWMPRDVTRALHQMAFSAAEVTPCPVSGTPTILTPPHTSTVMQSMMFGLVAPFMGFNGDMSDAMFTLCLAPTGTAERTLDLVLQYAYGDFVRQRELDSEFVAIDVEQLRIALTKYVSFVAMHRLLTRKGKKALDVLARTMYQNFLIVVTNTTVFLSGEADAEASVAHLRSHGITCSVKTAYALYLVLVTQTQRDQGSTPPNRMNILNIGEKSLPVPVVKKTTTEYDHARLVEICPATCRPYVTIDKEGRGVRFTRDDGVACYGPDYISTDNIYGLCLVSTGADSFPTEEQMIAYTARRLCTQSGDENAVLQDHALPDIRCTMAAMTPMIEACPELCGQPREFARRFLASADFNARVTMQQQWLQQGQ